MPVISLQIPVNEFLETFRHLFANGKDIREELLQLAMENSPVHSVDDFQSNVQV